MDMPDEMKCQLTRNRGGALSNGAGGRGGGRGAGAAGRQGLTLVPISAQLELFRPPCDPTQLINVSWSCSS